jgi:hypothetical protein
VINTGSNARITVSQNAMRNKKNISLTLSSESLPHVPNDVYSRAKRNIAA